MGPGCTFDASAHRVATILCHAANQHACQNAGSHPSCHLTRHSTRAFNNSWDSPRAMPCAMEGSGEAEGHLQQGCAFPLAQTRFKIKPFLGCSELARRAFRTGSRSVLNWLAGRSELARARSELARDGGVPNWLAKVDIPKVAYLSCARAKEPVQNTSGVPNWLEAFRTGSFRTGSRLQRSPENAHFDMNSTML